MNTQDELPTANLNEQNTASISLYQLSAVALATFFGTVLAGGYIMYINFKNLGLEKKAKNSLIYSFIATILILGISMLIPDEVPNMAIIVPQLLAMSHIAKTQQAAMIEEHINSGGMMFSNWKAFGISMLFLLAIFSIIFVTAWFTV